MALSLLANVDVILGFAILILTIFYRFEFPPVLGFLVIGMLIGPYGLEIVNGGEIVDLSTELGVIFLLFTIGIELSLNELKKMKKALLLGGLSISFSQQFYFLFYAQFWVSVLLSLFSYVF